jgi:outer membrane protein OmpA-like peptidoglycan-associated protein
MLARAARSILGRANMRLLRNISFGGGAAPRAAPRAALWAALWAALMVLLAAPTAALAQETSLSGLIVARDGDHMTVADSAGQQTVVTLTDQTRVTSVGGTFGLQKEDMAVTDLINGLAVNVKGAEAGGGVEATEVTFKPSDLKRAKVVEAGTAQVKAHAQALEAQNAELKQRMSEANQYVEKGSTTILFASGSATLTPQAKKQLQAIAAQAMSIKGYLIGVSGHADTTGDSLANQKLSERRSDAVIRYLQRSAKVQPYRILSSVAVGDIQQISNNDSPQGRAANRRVVVQVLTNKGLEGL